LLVGWGYGMTFASPTLNVSPADRARNMNTLFLQRLAVPGTAVAIATALGASEATVSRHKNDHAPMLFGVLAHLGLKIVPVEMCCAKPDFVRSQQALLDEAVRRLGLSSVAELAMTVE
jgi:hypothetical protein